MQTKLLLSFLFLNPFIFPMGKNSNKNTKQTKELTRAEKIKRDLKMYQSKTRLSRLNRLGNSIRDKQTNEKLTLSEECLLCSVLYKKICKFKQPEPIIPVISNYECVIKKLYQKSPFTREQQRKYDEFVEKYIILKDRYNNNQKQQIIELEQKVDNYLNNRKLHVLYNSLLDKDEQDKRRIRELTKSLENPIRVEIWPHLFGNKE